MPVYAYQCTKCSHTFEAYRAIEARHEISCEKCGSPCQILITGNVAIHTFDEYYSPNLRTVVRTKGQKARLMKEKGLEEYSSLDEVDREARKAERQQEEAEERAKPDERFIECYEKALVQHPR